MKFSERKTTEIKKQVSDYQGQEVDRENWLQKVWRSFEVMKMSYIII